MKKFMLTIDKILVLRILFQRIYFIKNISLSLILFTFLYSSCNDIIETDISEEVVFLYTPGDSMNLNYNKVIFIWDPVKDATDYILQIAKPEFPAIFIDTVVWGNKFEIALDSGQYQWRVIAENSGYSSIPSEEFTLIITLKDESPNEEYAKIILKAPINNEVVNDTIIRFEWSLDKNIEVEKYFIKIYPGDVYEELNDPFYTKSFDRFDQDISWQVYAYYNDIKIVSDFFICSIDVEPLAPTLIFPIDESILTLPFDMVWQRNTLDVEVDSIYIFDAADQMLAQFPVESFTGVYTVDNTIITSSGQYFWAVKSIDESENKSELSVKRSFTIQ